MICNHPKLRHIFPFPKGVQRMNQSCHLLLFSFYSLSPPRSTSWSPDAALREGVMQCCMRRWWSTSSEGQQARCQVERTARKEKRKKKRGIGTGKIVLSTKSIDNQLILLTGLFWALPDYFQSDLGAFIDKIADKKGRMFVVLPFLWSSDIYSQ